MRKIAPFLIAVFLTIAVMSCNTTHTVKVEPMHITIDVNVKVDKALDDFFGDIDDMDDTADKPSAQAEKKIKSGK